MNESLKVPWPAIYYTFQSKIAALQLDLLSTAPAACVNPNGTYFDKYQVNLVGIIGAVACVVFVYFAGSRYGMWRGLPMWRLLRFEALCVKMAISIVMATFIIGATARGPRSPPARATSACERAAPTR